MLNDKPDKGELPAPWNKYANDNERFQLSVIAERFGRNRATADEMLAARRLIMNRCIKRMRRDTGLE